VDDIFIPTTTFAAYAVAAVAAVTAYAVAAVHCALQQQQQQ
jgi:hypothetical protein